MVARCDRERSIACFSAWIEAVGQTRGGTKRCPKAIGSHNGSRVHSQAWPRERQALIFENGGNGKPRVGKKKPKRKRDKLKCFLCDGLHMLKKCLKKSVLKENPVGKAFCLRKSFIEGNDRADKKPNKLGSSKGKAEAMRAKRSKKKRVKCFL
ncbi:hypothetical protein Goshw_026374 [Gossypium schwendimanii]|uniref:Uncharacterized protein n=1 Tax=Gossypium schwendimanii TaxID=34291 RepID=A0A7J9N8Q3_GOSSC|nr:hypothetical protein [Gossypium schwendimanii]